MAERISKVAYKDGRVIIHTADEVIGERERKSEIKLYRDPHKDFTDAFAALEVHLRVICDLPSTVWKDKIRITGVSFSCNEDSGVEGAVMTAQAALDNADAPLCFNTPHLPFEQYSEGGVAKLMPEDAIEALNNLRDEAKKYLEGKASQGDLFDGSDESDAPRREAGSYAAETEEAFERLREMGASITVEASADMLTETVQAIIEPHMKGEPDYQQRLTKALDNTVGP